MDSSSIAQRIKRYPRILTIRTEGQLLKRMSTMTSHQLWIAMTQKGLAGWKHKILSDELHRRKQNLFRSSSFSPFLKELFS
jgi:hypothetical protein